MKTKLVSPFTILIFPATVSSNSPGNSVHRRTFTNAQWQRFVYALRKMKFSGASLGVGRACGRVEASLAPFRRWKCGEPGRVESLKANREAEKGGLVRSTLFRWFWRRRPETGRFLVGFYFSGCPKRLRSSIKFCGGCLLVRCRI